MFIESEDVEDLLILIIFDRLLMICCLCFDRFEWVMCMFVENEVGDLMEKFFL